MKPALTMLLALLAVLVAPGDGAALSKAAPVGGQHYYVPAVPADMDLVEFTLLTVGAGNTVADRFGHTGIRITDRAGGTDVVFNWGRFSFDKPGFLWSFFKGELIYSMGVRTFQADVATYMRQGRRMVEEKLNLTPRQKRRLMEKIAWNAVPENREFRYQYWFRNCATIPRDYLDEVLEGQVRAKFFAAPAGKRFRDYVRLHLAAVPFVVPGLDLAMNGNIDRPITAWEDMFLPGNLRRVLLDMPAVDDEGNPVPGSRLLSDSRVVVDERESFAAPFNDYAALAAVGLLPLGGALALLVRRRRGPMAYRLLGASALLWGLLAGAAGTMLLLNWVVSGHPDTWRNVNLLIVSPLDFLFAALGVQLLRAGAPVKDRLLFLHSGAFLGWAHAAGLALLGGLAAVGVIEQDVWRVAGWFGLTTLAVAGALIGYGLRVRPAPAAVQAQTARAGRGAKGRDKVSDVAMVRRTR